MADSLTGETDQGCVSPHLSPGSSLKTDLRQVLPNTKLNETIRIDKLIERENSPHANIYSVFDEQEQGTPEIEDTLSTRGGADWAAGEAQGEAAEPKTTAESGRCGRRTRKRSLGQRSALRRR